MNTNRINAEVLIGDFAQVSDGKLTVVGAGFDIVQVAGPVTFGVGILVHVPWSEMNRRHKFEVRVTDGDGHRLAGPDGTPVTIEGEFETGRPPGLIAGTSITIAQAMMFGGAPLANHTTYTVAFHVEGAATPIASAQFQTRPPAGQQAA